LYGSDIMRDGDPKAVFVEPAPNSTFGTELDVVDASATVSLVRKLQGGFANVASGGGLQVYVPDPVVGYDVTVIRFQNGAWRIASDAKASQAQAQAQSSQPFYDPSGQRA